MVCDIGNPILTKQLTSFVIRASPSPSIVGSDYTLPFFFSTNSSNVEDPEELWDNALTLEVPVTVVTELQLTGVSRPEQLLFNITSLEDLLHEKDAGPEVQHIYEVNKL